MLCSTQVHAMMPHEYSRHHETHSSNGSSPILPLASTPSLSTNYRHHVRSFSTEQRFDQSVPAWSASAASTSTVSASNATAEALTTQPTDSSSFATRSPSPFDTTTFSKPPTRSKRSASVDGDSVGVLAPHQKNTSPRKPSHLQYSIDNHEEQESLAKLKSSQASRRPRVQRFTPAFSSLPSRISLPLDAFSYVQETKKEATESTSRSIEFPTKEASQPAKASEQSVEPGAGLQLDLACIPSPSVEDLEGPVSTSRIDNLLRDRHGNPIKPSLKSKSTVSPLLPGRTTRSDSTPTLPPSGLDSRSVPTTPTVHKNVHFDTHLEHIKLFKNRQRPTAVSRDHSPEQTETETEEERDMFPYIWRRGSLVPASNPLPPAGATTSSTDEQLVLRLPNFPSSTRLSTDRIVFLERIFLADDLRSVKGTVQVQNKSFEKWVAVRYTLDHWATIGEVSAEYSESIKGGLADRFTFSIKLNELLNWPRGSAGHETKSMFMCIRYTCCDTEFWDNNDSKNYQLDFRRRPMPVSPSTSMANKPPHANIATSVASEFDHPTSTKARVLQMARRGVGGKGFAMEDLKRELEKLRSDDEEEGFTRVQLLAAETRSKRSNSSPPRSPDSRSISPSIWSARYDFGKSLRDSGRRSSEQERAGAANLDYFSTRPSSYYNASAEHANTPCVHVSVSSPPKTMQELPSSKPAPAFGNFGSAHFGMLSPGLGNETVEHLPTGGASGSGSATASGTPSPATTPTIGKNQLAHAPTNSSSSYERFNSFPPRRQSPSQVPPSVLQAFEHRPSPRRHAAVTRYEDGELGSHSKNNSFDSTSSSNGNERSPNSSPPSDGSPNPFSPSVSVSSLESDTTLPASQSSLEDRTAQAKAAATSLVSPLASSVNSDEETRLRPASMSDYNELISRFCWNQDLVPSGGSMVPDVPTNGGLGKSNARNLCSSQAHTSPNSDSGAGQPLSPTFSSGSSTPTRAR